MKLTFVIPWYGERATGGAETLARQTAEALSALGGYDVEVLTTCVPEFQSDWSHDELPAGTEEINGVVVRRFPVRARNTAAFDAVNLRLMAGEGIGPEEERTFIGEMIHSPALYDFIRANGSDRVFFFLPYMFGPVYEGAAIHPDRSVLIPCLHDESYAYLFYVRETFARVRGVGFLTPAERRLAERLYEMRPGAPRMLGGGFDTDFEFNPDRFEAKYGLRDFLLYAGRREAGKNVPLLLDYFARYKRACRGTLKLVLIGKGKVDVPPAIRGDVLDLGFVSERDKRDAYAAALALCQPSLNESFSIVTMEAWITGTPALVHSGCAVTSELCREANAGLCFGDAAEFAQAVEWLRQNPVARRRLGAQGGRYVLSRYTWDAVVDNYARALREWGLSWAPRPRARREVGLRPGGVTEVHQVLAGVRKGDAISQMAVTIQSALRSWGFASETYARHIHPDSADRVWPLEDFPNGDQAGRLMIYHYSIHSEASDLFARYPGRRMIVYHNITPPHFFAGYSDTHVPLLRQGRQRLAEIVRGAELCLGDSRYNCREMERHGGRNCRPLAILPDLERLTALRPDEGILESFKGDAATFLFVGRLAANKRQDDVVRAFGSYQRRFEKDARLVLVGGFDETGRYQAEIRQIAREMGIEEQVILTGLVNDTALATYYRAADVFLSMSEHEGLCVPIVEAMGFDVPVVAYGAAAIPDTLAGAGAVVDRKDFGGIAAILHRVVSDASYRREIVEGQRERLRYLSPAKQRGMLKLYLEELLDS